MMQIRFLLAVPALAALLLHTGCSRTGLPSPADLPIVYKIDVQQGNDITQDMLAQLRPGMERAKVKFIMGTPMVADTFHDDRWDYVYTMQKRGGERMQRHVSLYFRDDKLERVAGDVKPAQGAIAPSGDSAATTVEVPAAEKGLISRVKDKVAGDDDKQAASSKAAEGATDGGVAKTADDTAATDGGVAKAADETSSTDSAGAPADASTGSEAAPSGDGEFVIDNAGSGDAPAEQSTTATTDETAASATAEEAATGDGLMPRFQAESNLEDAVLRDTAAEAASGSSGDDGPATGSAAGGTGKTTEVTIPEDAPAPKNKKGFFGRMLEKVGIGDDEGGSQPPADASRKDVSNPENQ